MLRKKWQKQDQISLDFGKMKSKKRKTYRIDFYKITFEISPLNPILA
jgi:hypothetical protein